MPKLFRIGLVVCFAVIAGIGHAAVMEPRVVVSMDKDWRFFLGDAAGADATTFDDGGWRALDVPHDWSIEGSFSTNNPAGGAGGYLPAGVGWYRKHFTLPDAESSRRLFIGFDGVMANSDVWINGFHLGKRPYGYVSFEYELTSHLVFGAGKTNVLAIRADNSQQPASRWYAGAGIYRHVRLVSTSPVHVAQWGTFVTTPSVSSNAAKIHIQSTVINQSDASRDVTVTVALISPSGRMVLSADASPQSIASGKEAVFQQDLEVKNPQLWDLDNRNLYQITTRVRAGNELLDENMVPFGIREARFDAATGFWLNGKNLKLKGVCLHQDASGLGVAVPLRAWERRLELLKEAGCNAIRTAHNPPAPEFLDLCDRMGFLVMDEMFDCWTVAKNRYDYHVHFNEWSKIDTRDTVRRDRNHPSVVLYSAGNEIHDTPKAELAKDILGGLVEVFHESDPSRPVTQALFRPNVSHDYDDGLADMLDVVGQNYRENEILAAHETKPTRKIVGTENGHDRRVWLALRDNAPYAGQFLWSGIDYLGESRRWPLVAAGSGLFDRCGTPRARAFERQSWWSGAPMVHIVRRTGGVRLTPADPGFDPLMQRNAEASDWTPSKKEPHDENVEVYSNCEEVELLLNGKSLGSQKLHEDASPRTWQVTYEPGTIQAIARNGGKQVAVHELKTAGQAAAIMLTADRPMIAADFDDVTYVSATIVDEHGVMVPDAADLVSFKLEGPGRIAAVDSGDNASHEPFQSDKRKAYHGLCFAILKAASPGGNITLSASAEGLKGATVRVQVVAPGK